MRMSSMQMVSKLDMPLPLLTMLGNVQLALLGHPAAQQNQSRPFQSPFLLQRECAKVKSNTTCKSSISQVSLQMYQGPKKLSCLLMK